MNEIPKKVFITSFICKFLLIVLLAEAFGLWTDRSVIFGSPTTTTITTYFLESDPFQPSGSYYDQNGILQFSTDGFHHGIDIASGGRVDENRVVISDTEPVYAALDGEVVFGGFLANGYGHQVIMYNGFNLNGNSQHTYTFYSHLGTVNGTSFISVETGQIIPAGWQIGRQGNSGFTIGRTGIHLDFEIRLSPTPIIDWSLTAVKRGDIPDLIAASPDFYLKKNLTRIESIKLVKRIRKPGPWPQIPSENIIDWPMVKHDLERTNSASQLLLPNLIEKWQTLITSKNLPRKNAIFKEKIYIAEQNEVRVLESIAGQILKRFNIESAITTSPVVTDNLLFILADDQNLYALDLENGNIKWKFLTNKKSFISPLVFGGNIYFCGDKLYVLDASTGKEIWSKHINCDLASNPIIAGNGIIYASQSKESFASEEQIIALDSQAGRTIWKEIVRSFRDLVFSKNALYLNSVGALISVDANTGERKWLFTCPTPAVEINIDMFLTISDDKIYLVCDNFKLVSGFFVPRGEVFKLDAANGSIIWQVSFSNFLSEPIISGNTIYAPLLIPFASGKILAIDGLNGATLQEINVGPFFKEFLPGIFRFDPPTIAIGSNLLFSGDSNGNLHAFGK